MPQYLSQIKYRFFVVIPETYMYVPIPVLSSLSHQAVAKMVQECYKYVDTMTDLTIKLRLIDTLRTVTAGKVWISRNAFVC